MARIKIGNVKGPAGAQGKQGNQGERGVRGSRWVFGKAITGTSSQETCFASGIADALPEDCYFNLDTCNVYRCVTGGDEQVATWVYVGNLKGKDGNVVNVEDVFTSESTDSAASARLAKVLYDSLEGEKKKIVELQENSTLDSVVTDTGEDESVTESVHAFSLSRIIEGVRKLIYPISHAKAIWWNRPQNITVYDKVDDMDKRLSELSGLPTIRYGTEPPDDSVGEDGDVYIQLTETE